MDIAKHTVTVRVLTLLSDLEFSQHYNSHIATPVARYLLSLWRALPVTTIIVGERPYYTDILPPVASAIAYDPSKTLCPTPSTHYLACDISAAGRVSYSTAETWFRDGWKYLNSGVLLINICVFREFMHPRSLRERVLMERFIRDVILVSNTVSNAKITVIAMGNPARHSVNNIRSSIPGSKNVMVVHGCPNPAGLRHKDRDPQSRSVTLETPSVTRVLTQLILRTAFRSTNLSLEDYAMSISMSSHVDKVISSSGNCMKTWKEIATYFKSIDKAKNDDAGDMFNRAADEMAEFVLSLQGLRVQLMLGNVSEPPGIAKQTFYNQRQPYNPTVHSKSRGTMSNVSSRTPARSTSTQLSIAPADEGSDEDPPPVTPVSRLAAQTPRRGTVVDRTLRPDDTLTPGSGTRQTASSASGVRGRSQQLVVVTEDLDSDDNNPASDNDQATDAPTVATRTATPSGLGLTQHEVACMYEISNFIEADEAIGGIPRIVGEVLNETASNRRATPGLSEHALRVVRSMIVKDGNDAVTRALGYIDGTVSMPSEIIIWLQSLIKE